MLHSRGKSHSVQHLVEMVCCCDVTVWRQWGTNDPVINSDSEDREPQSIIIHLENMMDFMRLSCYEILYSPADIASKNAGMQDIGSKQVFVKIIIIRIIKNKEAELKAVFLQLPRQSPMRATDIPFQDCSDALISSEADCSQLAATLRGRKCSQPVHIIQYKSCRIKGLVPDLAAPGGHK